MWLGCVSPAVFFKIIFSGINDEILTFMSSVWYFSTTAAQCKAPKIPVRHCFKWMSGFFSLKALAAGENTTTPLQKHYFCFPFWECERLHIKKIIARRVSVMDTMTEKEFPTQVVSFQRAQCVIEGTERDWHWRRKDTSLALFPS